MEDNKTKYTSKEDAEDIINVSEPCASDENEETKQPDGEHHEHSHSSHHHSHGHHHHHHHHSHHSHSSHHHHSRHGKHRSKGKYSSENKNKVFKFVKRNKYKIINALISVFVVVLLILLALKNDSALGHKDNNSGNNSSQEITNSTVVIESSVYNGEVSLAHPAITEYINGDPKTALINDVWRKYRDTSSRIDAGLPVVFKYTVKGMPAGVTLEKSDFEISVNEDYSFALKYELESTEDTLNLYNLLPGTHYFYRLKLELSGGAVLTTSGDFVTASSPRILSVDGTLNVRDFGGWKLADGKTIPYGMLYRGGELDGAVDGAYLISEEGKRTLLMDLGVKYDLDLRSPTVNATPVDILGQYVEHVYYDLGMYTDVFKPEYTENVRRVFSDLANPSNYPVYLHCTYGRDRTGTVCYILGALLGMSNEDLKRDYELSMFASGYIDVAGYASLITRFEMLEGSTNTEKAENYLLSVGVTAEEIASIKNIFLGE